MTGLGLAITLLNGKFERTTFTRSRSSLEVVLIGLWLDRERFVVVQPCLCAAKRCYDIIRGVFVLFAFAKVEVIWFDTCLKLQGTFKYLRLFHNEAV